MTEQIIRRLLNREEAAAFLNISLSALDRLSDDEDENGLPVVHLGRRVLFHPTLLDDWVRKAAARDCDLKGPRRRGRPTKVTTIARRKLLNPL
jgi:hypothetical protein